MSEMIEVKTADLIGPALDWAVAQADGQEVALICPPIIDENNRPALLLNKKRWLLSGEPAKFWLPSTDWSQGGPLIEKYAISFNHYCIGGKNADGSLKDAMFACIGFRRTVSGKNAEGRAEPGQYLVAACRAIVAAKLGDVVQVPSQILEVAQ